MRLFRTVLVTLVLLVTAGCGDAEKRVEKGTGADDAVLLRINGEDFTARYLREKVELAYAKASVANGRKLAMGSAREFNAFAMQNFRNYVTEFLVEQAARRSSVAIEPVDVSNALQRINVATGRNFTKIDQFESFFPQRFAMLKRDFEVQCRLMAYLRVEEGMAEVTDEDIDAYYILVDNEEKRYEKIDREQRQKVATALAALKGGMSWKEALEKYSEDYLDNREDFGEDWGTWSVETVPFKQMIAPMVNLMVGGFSEPIETEDGLLILRLMDKPDEGRYHLGRLLVRLTERSPRPSRAEVADILMESSYVGAINSAKSQLVKNLRLEYPMGSNFTYKVWQEPPPKARPERRRANTNGVSKAKGELKK